MKEEVNLLMSKISDFRKKLKSNPETAKLLMPGTKYEALLDLDGDGKMDFALMDTTGDGNPDTFAADMTGSGSLNIYFFDADGDSVADTVQFYRDGTDKPSYIKNARDDEEKLLALGRSLKEGMEKADAGDLIARFNRIKNVIAEGVKAYHTPGTLGRMRAAMKADPKMAGLLCDSPINELFFDLNGDGIADFALIDTDHTGEIDTFAIDFQNDGEFDLYLTGTDRTGVPDKVSYYLADGDEPVKGGAAGPRLEELLRPAAMKFMITLRSNFNAENLVEAMKTYKDEVVVTMHAYKDEVNA
jgi:hypothetical protein